MKRLLSATLSGFGMAKGPRGALMRECVGTPLPVTKILVQILHLDGNLARRPRMYGSTSKSYLP